MRKSSTMLLTLACAALLVMPVASTALAEELVVKSCAELQRLADSYRDDLNTADTVLGSAIDMGTVEMIRNYKLRKQAARQQLEAVSKALELRGCLKAK